jgi:hypothetical protein
VEGKVLEAETNKPVADALVVTRWQGTYSAIAETKTVCYYVETTTTDPEGRYKIPAWSAKSKGPFFSPEAMGLTAHKPGYETYLPLGYARTEAYRKNIRYLKPFTGGREERLKYLERTLTATSCGSQDESDKNLILLRKALYEEANRIAVTKEDKMTVINLLQAVESLELGSDKSWENWRERRKNLQ